MSDTWEPTSEEIELLATAEEDIAKKHETFSFDYNAFSERLQDGDRWQQLIQAHLYFEHVVAQTLSEALPKPEAISLQRMGFSHRLDLAEAMALFPEELIKPVRKISALRNKIAHDLKFEVTEDDIRDLENCTPVYLRNILRDVEHKAASPLELRELLKIVLFRIDIIRQQNAASRELGRKAELRLRMVLKKTKGMFVGR